MSGYSTAPFGAPEYQADASVRWVRYRFSGTVGRGWEVWRDGRIHLRLGPGYRLLPVSHCGVCATDLVRRHLPFALPQVIGHEVVALDDGVPAAVEINASHASRGLAPEQWCAFCRSGLASHCPERLVLGIQDLPGGFAPWLLAPAGNIIALPPSISPLSATLIEPFAAALHAVRAVAPADGERVAVLGPRRLGSLVLAALAAWRRQSGRRFEIVAIVRRPQMRALAKALGADEALDAAAVDAMRDIADVVVDTTGNPNGTALAIQLATREVHVKSTTGQPALGLSHLTELVVDELALARYESSQARQVQGLEGSKGTVVAVGGGVPAAVLRELAAGGREVVAGDDPGELSRGLSPQPFGAADLAVVTSLAGIDTAIRPVAGIERGLVRARGTILVADVGQPRSGVLAAVLDKGLRVSSSRCGDFRSAIALLADPANGLGQRLGELMVTHLLPARQLAAALAAAAAPASVKVVVTQPGALV